jgi:23S rRNA (cytidine1920-2'-O)/16S rRNA (cytidine1409-2'-O)-methyltransferase
MLMQKMRLDVLMVERGLAESRALAQRLVMAGQVRVNGQVVLKPATGFLPEAQIEVDRGPRFVSRGGEKLEAALNTFQIDLSGRVCADVGASTGGFTDCMLQHGAGRIYAIDVGQGILSWKLRQDARVVVMEGTNARYLEHLPEAVDFVTVDVSFISLKIILPVVKRWLISALTPDPSPLFLKREGRGEQRVGGEVIALIKPQFEAGKREVGRGSGVIRDPQVHRRVLLEVLSFAQQEGYGVGGLRCSPLLGPKGNAEFLAWLVYPGASRDDLADTVEKALLN